MAVGDKLESEIKRWIETAESSKDKATLMILYQINASLTENTVATKSISTDFHGHREKVERVLNRLSGGWIVFIILIGVVQALGGYIISREVDHLSRESSRNDEQERRISTLEGSASLWDRETILLRERMARLENERPVLRLQTK